MYQLKDLAMTILQILMIILIPVSIPFLINIFMDKQQAENRVGGSDAVPVANHVDEIKLLFDSLRNVGICAGIFLSGLYIFPDTSISSEDSNEYYKIISMLIMTISIGLFLSNIYWSVKVLPLSSKKNISIVANIIFLTVMLLIVISESPETKRKLTLCYYTCEK